MIIDTHVEEICTLCGEESTCISACFKVRNVHIYMYSGISLRQYY